MFGWRRRSEGFEWQEYVRTTVLVRRADRQRRLDDARLAALAKVQEAKDIGIEAGKAGLDAAAQSAARAASATGRTLAEMAMAAIYAIGDFFAGVAAVIVKIVTPYLPAKSDAAETRTPVHQRFRDRQDAKPRGDAQPAPRAPRPLPDIGPKSRAAMTYAVQGAAALVLILVAGRMLQSGGPGGLETGSVAAPTQTIAADPQEFSGRAQVISGDALKINGVIVRLAGVAAPEETQPCFSARGRRWSCSASARKALERLVRGRTVVCEPTGKDQSGFTRAACAAGSEDVAQALVRDGHIFAEPGASAGYTAAEAKAIDAKIGVWQGERVRPEEWRSQVWEDAKRSAPDGCPIRGIVRSGQQIYAMPWSSEYVGARGRANKGDRWFCSEQQARDAGFSPSIKS